MTSSSGMPRAVAMAAPIDVVVCWCGINYPVQVSSNATVAELKRKISEIAGLPCKRQKHCNTMDMDKDLTDDVFVSSLQPDHSTKLIGLNQYDDKTYQDLFFGRQRKTECLVTNNREPLLDFDGSKTQLSISIYEVGNMSISCLIKTHDDLNPVNPSSYKLMKMFTHPGAILIENIYKSGPLFRLVLLPICVDGTFNGWTRKHGIHSMINLEGGTFTSLFRKLIIELCHVLDKLIKFKVCPKNLTKDNLYLQMVNGEARLKVLFNDVETFSEHAQKEKLCLDVGTLILDGFTNPNVETKSFCDFLQKQGPSYIGKNLAKVLKSYPDTWTYEDKGPYLIAVTSSAESSNLNKSRVAWPKDETGRDELQHLKQMMEKENEKRRRNMKDGAANKFEFKWNYEIAYPRDFVRLGRNLWKHFSKFPIDIQEFLGGNREGLLRKLEEWCPNLWCLIYDAMGPA